MKYKFKTEPFAHQLEVLEQSWDKKYYGLFLEMGCGKTKITIDNAAMLFKAGEIDAMLVIAPKLVYRNWEKEFKLHWPDELEYETFSYNNTAKAQKELLAFISKPFNDCLPVFLINVESFVGKGLMFAKSFVTLYDNCFSVVDESTYIKNAKAARTKAAISLGKKSKYKRILTGTPVSNGPMDLWGQAKFLGDWLLGQKTFSAFRERYCRLETRTFGARQFVEVTGYKNLDELKLMCNAWSSSIRKEDCLDLPEKIFTNMEIPLTKKQKDMYTSFVDFHLAEFEGDFIEATSAMALFYKLHQIVCGQLKTEDGEYMKIDNNRIDAVITLLKEAGDKQVVIWSSYKLTQEMIYEAIINEFGMNSAAHVLSSMNTDRRQEEVNSFVDGTSQFFIGNPASAGYGNTFVNSHLAIYYNNTFSLEKRLQSEDRLHRIGQSNKVTYIDLHTKGTIEDRIMQLVYEKKELSEKMFPRKELEDLIRLKG